MSDKATKPTRFMRMDQMSFDEPAAMLQIVAPDILTAEELDDVREMFAIKLRQWERRLAAEAAGPNKPDPPSGQQEQPAP